MLLAPDLAPHKLDVGAGLPREAGNAVVGPGTPIPQQVRQRIDG
ncbi:Uncharacterized protein PPKH_4444 [Pseudomonas putida]|nr:Uncharacterized protein PPKH_4444 [Pseudomonas putida]